MKNFSNIMGTKKNIYYQCNKFILKVCIITFCLALSFAFAILNSNNFIANASEMNNCYCGRVVASNYIDEQKNPVEGATIIFTPSDGGQISKAQTNALGKFDFEYPTFGNMVPEGTSGTIDIEYKDQNNNWYSNDQKTINAPITTDFEIYKLESLQVQIKDKLLKSMKPMYSDITRNTCWCPVFSENRTDIKFFDYNRVLIPDNGNGYCMEDIASKTKDQPGEAYKSQANYFVFTNSVHAPLNCFQTIGLPWNDVFKLNNDADTMANDIKFNIIKNRIKALPKNSDASIDNITTIYKINNNWNNQWTQIENENNTTDPSVFGIPYSYNSNNDGQKGLIDIYGNYNNSIEEDSQVLCKWAKLPWNASSVDSKNAYYFDSLDGNWKKVIKLAESSCVLEQIFS